MTKFERVIFFGLDESKFLLSVTNLSVNKFGDFKTHLCREATYRGPDLNAERTFAPEDYLRFYRGSETYQEVHRLLDAVGYFDRKR